jgi:hypothetical protein
MKPSSSSHHWVLAIPDPVRYGSSVYASKVITLTIGGFVRCQPFGNSQFAQVFSSAISGHVQAGSTAPNRAKPSWSCAREELVVQSLPTNIRRPAEDSALGGPQNKRSMD